MSFWNLSDNKQTLDTTGNFDAGGGDIEPIPKDTQVKAACDEAKWDMNPHNGDEYISLRWNVLAPEDYKGRKIFQKVRVLDAESKKADKAKRMLAAIATNAGGGLLKVEGKPTDNDLQSSLQAKPMALTLQVWEMEKDDGSGKMSGNWVQQVAPLKSSNKKVTPAKETEPASEEDDDVGF